MMRFALNQMTANTMNGVGKCLRIAKTRSGTKTPKKVIRTNSPESSRLQNFRRFQASLYFSSVICSFDAAYAGGLS